MLVAVEMNTLKVTHVHHSDIIIGALGVIEAGPAPYDLLFDNTANRSFLFGLTTLELETLYRNLTGSQLSASNDLARRQAIASVVNNIVPRDATLDEALSQMEYVQENPGQVYRYVRGSTIPAIPQANLWPVKGVHLTANELQKAELEAPQRLVVREAPSAADEPKRAPSRPASGGVSNPTGGSRPAIWAHADKQWEAAGKPRAEADVLRLRKVWMVELEEQGIKKSTSSTALGDWMKKRLSEQ